MAVEVGTGKRVSGNLGISSIVPGRRGTLAYMTVIILLSVPCRGPLNILPPPLLPAWRGCPGQD